MHPCVFCNSKTHESSDLDACSDPTRVALRKPEPAPETTYRCINCNEAKVLDDMRWTKGHPWVKPGAEICDRCFRGGKHSEPQAA